MKSLPVFVALATLCACASPKPVPPAPVAAPHQVVEPLHEEIKPLTVEQDEQISPPMG
ncbi:hypothetical protein [Mesorhizobium sp. ANAO-SY3R2]|uniref:hypothetical protein n=1 Tax=Mesorhizobium sp. ANAO-SY3R2 TaxID=3166644 RepID=UPI003670DD65